MDQHTAEDTPERGSDGADDQDVFTLTAEAVEYVDPFPVEPVEEDHPVYLPAEVAETAPMPETVEQPPLPEPVETAAAPEVLWTGYTAEEDPGNAAALASYNYYDMQGQVLYDYGEDGVVLFA
jgi:hypothetical protein